MKPYSEVEYIKEIKDKSIEVEGREPWEESIWPLLPVASGAPWGTSRVPWSMVWKPLNLEQPSYFSAVVTKI